jgi:tricorn protease
MTSASGYYRFPTICNDTIVFVCEDDLWTVSVHGGIARRLTAGQGACSHPRLSPDGKQVAFVAREEGDPEVYTMPAEGGPSRRITFTGSRWMMISGWSSDGLRIAFASDAKAYLGCPDLYEVDAAGGQARPLKLGHAVSIAAATSGAIVIGRNNSDPARWKRYRGGTAGELWIDPKGRGNFARLVNLKGNLASPMWLNGRVFFLSDHEGIGNIYSCRPDGSDLKRHTHHDEYYVRFPSTDGRRIVYTCGADIYVLDPGKDQYKRIDVQMAAARRQNVRKFMDASHNIHYVSLHPQAHSIGLISRGQPFTMPFWEEAGVQHGVGSKTRYRFLEWLPCGTHFVVTNDLSGYDRVEVHTADQSGKPYFATNKDIGRIMEMAVSPARNTLAVSNHKHELVLIDIDKKKTEVVDHCPVSEINSLSWSPDGRWVAYSYSQYPGATNVRVYDTEKREIHDVTRPIGHDFSTSWDPDGNYLYFLSVREFNPVYDQLMFDLGFPFATRPYLLALRKDVKSPFIPTVRPLVETTPGFTPAKPGESTDGDKKTAGKTQAQAKGKVAAAKKKADATRSNSKKKDAPAAPSTPQPPQPKPVGIDFEGIEDRVLAFPVEEGQYSQIVGLTGRAAFLQRPVKGIKRGFRWWNSQTPGGTMLAYDFKENRSGVLQHNVQYFVTGRDNRTIVYSCNNRLRVCDGLAGLDAPAGPASDEANRKTGWIDLRRVSVMIEPQAEWKQMFDETWRLQRDHFWTESMSNVDWELIYDRYASLLPRVSARTELSDLIWEMQGELGTSHAYEMGGDYRWPPGYYRGFLGADLSFDEESGGYRIDHIYRGDSWDPDADSPLGQPGLGVKVGDCIIAVGGRPVSKTCSVDELLLNCFGKEVMLTLTDGKKNKKRVAVKCLGHEGLVRYLSWVEANRKYVHEKTKGKVGYVHIPDMSPAGYSEFHRGYLNEIHREGLIVDVRYNGGGHVSQLLLEKLARKRVGYDISRWGQPEPYPMHSVAGAMVAITNQFAGSDGDIFSHCFKLYKLGPLVGKRTWGGVIGINARHSLVDGTITTQPEYSFWFNDVGWGVENYGTDPDYDVDITPQDYRLGRDPQMDKALELILDEMKKKPFKMPKFDQRPSLPLPKLKKPVAKR